METEQTIYLEFADRPTEQLVIAPDCTGSGLCTLIAERILFEESADSLILNKKAGDKLLDLDLSLEAQNVEDEEHLLVYKSRRLPLSGKRTARLREVEMGDVYPILWQPALIGRPGYVRDKELLAVDLEWLPDGLTVSRNHAFIFERDGMFFIRHIAGEHNETSINGERIAPNEDHALKDGDAITVGRRHITLSFLLDLPREL